MHIDARDQTFSGKSSSVILEKNLEYFFLLRILTASYIDHLKYFLTGHILGVFYLYHKNSQHASFSSADIFVSFFLIMTLLNIPGFGFFS